MQGWSVAGEGGMFTSLFTFTPRGKGFIYSQENVFNRVLPPSFHQEVADPHHTS